MLEASKKEELIKANTDQGESINNIHIAKHTQYCTRTLPIRLRSAAAVGDFRPGPSPVAASAVFLLLMLFQRSGFGGYRLFLLGKLA